MSSRLDAALLNEATDVVARGGTLIFPTDTVYGIGCAANDDRAVETIFAAKHRPADKPLAVHAATPEAATAYAEMITRAARAIMDRFWPGPVTIIVRRRADVARVAARGGATIGLRCPGGDTCSAILAATGPLAATSANISGAPAYDGGEDLSTLPDADLAIIAGPTKQRRESTVLDCSGETVHILRAGALDQSQIAAALSGVATVIDSSAKR